MLAHSPHVLESLGATVVPEDGSASPLFAALDAGDALHVTALFARPLDDAEINRVEIAALDWFARAGRKDSLPELVDEALSPSCLHLAIAKVGDPRRTVESLATALAKARVPVARMLLARIGPGELKLRALVDPQGAPVRRYEDKAKWWRACFDETCAPPISEDREELATDDNALIEGERLTFVERRPVPLHLRGLRICYGLGAFDFVPTDRRALDVARVFRTALEARFHASATAPRRPTPYNVKHQRDTAIDRVSCRGRIGYSCAFDARDLRELLHGNAFRYREYELMLALRDTARALDLAPVVCWKRFSRRYVVQLWEKNESHETSFAA